MRNDELKIHHFMSNICKVIAYKNLVISESRNEMSEIYSRRVPTLKNIQHLVSRSLTTMLATFVQINFRGYIVSEMTR